MGQPQGLPLQLTLGGLKRSPLSNQLPCKPDHPNDLSRPNTGEERCPLILHFPFSILH